MSKRANLFSILIPGITVFISSFCIMVLELIASRLIARHLGSSLYTWTSVIGVVLAGITIGNYLGGRIADSFPAKKTLAVLFGLCSVACVVVVILNNLVGNWMWLWHFNWPARIFTHVSLVFLLPSVLLGTVSPVVAKMALDKGLATGRTVGDIYAWGAAGSIAGTFMAGFYLIAAMGTIAIIWTVGAILLLMGILYWFRLWVLYIWAAIFIVLMTMGMAPAEWAKNGGTKIAVRKAVDPKVIYEDESQYCYIAVKRVSEKPDERIFLQDKLTHSKISIDDITDLQYFYTHIYAAITNGLSQGKKSITTLTIGGGGYAYPQYLEKVWPGSHIDVVEIDPAVTKAAMAAFGLAEDTTINTITMDARNYVDDLLRQKQTGGQIPKYDFIYEDAINDYTVPPQLVTKEFNDKIAEILAEDGVYMVNLIDVFDIGQFLGSIVNTLHETFPYVYVVAKELHIRSTRNTFVVISSRREIDVQKLLTNYKKESKNFWFLTDSDIQQLTNRSRNLVLTDDYVPAENLLADVVRVSAKSIMGSKYLSRGYDLKHQKHFSESIASFQTAIEADELLSVRAYNEIGLLYSAMGQLEKAAEAFSWAIEFDDRTGSFNDVASIHFNLGVVFKRIDKPQQSREHFLTAIDGFQKELAGMTSFHGKVYKRLGDTYAIIGDFEKAAEVFHKALDLQPGNLLYCENLSKALEYAGRYDEAIGVLRKQIELLRKHDRSDNNIKKLLNSIDFLEYKKTKQRK